MLFNTKNIWINRLTALMNFYFDILNCSTSKTHFSRPLRCRLHRYSQDRDNLAVFISSILLNVSFKAVSISGLETTIFHPPYRFVILMNFKSSIVVSREPHDRHAAADYFCQGCSHTLLVNLDLAAIKSWNWSNLEGSCESQ